MDKDQQIADDLIGRQIDIFRFSASERQAVLKILKRLEEDLVQLLFYSGKALTDIGRADKARLLKQAQEIIEQYYEQMGASAAEGLAGIGRFEAQRTAASLATAFAGMIEPGLPTEGYFKVLVRDTLISGAPSGTWWERQAGDTSFRFANEVRQGLAAGETNAQLVQRIRGRAAGFKMVDGKRVYEFVGGVMGISTANANSLVQTSVQTVANASRFETFKQNDDVIKGYSQLSTLDGHTTLVCVGYSGKEWDKDLKPVGHTFPFVSEHGAQSGTPRHWGCRSLITPKTKTFKELGIDIPEFRASTRAASGGPVAGDTTMKAYLDRRTPAQLDEQLGKGRADLYREGKITLPQLLDQAGRPLTLAQLRAKYDR